MVEYQKCVIKNMSTVYKCWNRTMKNHGGKCPSFIYGMARNKRILLAGISLILSLQNMITHKLYISMTKWEHDCGSNLQYVAVLGGERRRVSLPNQWNGMYEVMWFLVRWAICCWLKWWEQNSYPAQPGERNACNHMMSGLTREISLV